MALLGSLNGLGYGLQQLLGQISAGLTLSLTEYDVYDRNRDPAESVAIANAALKAAAVLAGRRPPAAVDHRPVVGRAVRCDE